MFPRWLVSASKVRGVLSLFFLGPKWHFVFALLVSLSIGLGGIVWRPLVASISLSRLSISSVGFWFGLKGCHGFCSMSVSWIRRGPNQHFCFFLFCLCVMWCWTPLLRVFSAPLVTLKIWMGVARGGYLARFSWLGLS